MVVFFQMQEYSSIGIKFVSKWGNKLAFTAVWKPTK